jgi:hypothetical protein
MKNITNKNKVKKIGKNVLKTLPWGWFFIMLIPLYAAVYYFLPDGNLDFGGMGHNLLSCIYLSSSTVTTLGIGDISPVTSVAAVLLGSECILGVLFAGLFLNAIAFKKSNAVSQKKEHEADIEKYDYECKKMLQFCKVIDVALKHYETALLRLLDERFRSLSDITEDMTVADMPHIFETVFSKNSDSVYCTRIVHFIRLNNNTVSAVKQLIREINMEYWPEFESLCLDFVDKTSDLRIDEFFMTIEEYEGLNEKWKTSLNDVIKAGDPNHELTHKERELQLDDVFTPFLDLRDIIVNAAAFIIKFRESTAEIAELDPETIVVS